LSSEGSVWRWRDERIFPTAFDQINQLTELRADLPWLADVAHNVCTRLLVELDKAFQRCFRRHSRPALQAQRLRLSG
jgi:hypothetical protein